MRLHTSLYNVGLVDQTHQSISSLCIQGNGWQGSVYPMDHPMLDAKIGYESRLRLWFESFESLLNWKNNKGTCGGNFCFKAKG